MRILKIFLILILCFSIIIPSFVFADDIIVPIISNDDYSLGISIGYNMSDRDYLLSLNDYNFYYQNNLTDYKISDLAPFHLAYFKNGSYYQIVIACQNKYDYTSSLSCNSGLNSYIYHSSSWHHQYINLPLYYRSSSSSILYSDGIGQTIYDKLNTSIPVFDNLDLALDYLSSSFSGIPPLIPFTGEGITVPAGYCCVIDRAFNDVVSTETYSPLPDYAYLTCTTNEKSPIIGDWVTGASYGYQNNLDLSNISSLNTINWIINPNKDKTGLFNNRSYNAFKEIISNTSSRYILISNPPYSNYSSENNTFVSPIITINFVYYDGTPYHGFCGWYKLYRYDSLNNHSYVISEDNPITWQGEPNESGDGYTQQGWGDEYTTPPAQLGGYPISSSESSDNLISILSRYFGLGQEKVDQLSSQGQGFFSFLSNLYSWMPTELLTIISSVFIIFLVVACIKLFL